MAPYGIKGATWYQGEWDSRSASDSEKYYWQMPCLIDEWRTDWGQGDFPFYIVQMPKMGLSTIHIVRDAELQTALNDPKAEMIVTIDNPGRDVHPPCKDTNFGVRLALLARKFEYGHNIDARSPFYNEAASYVSGDTINVVFDNVAGGLQSSGGPLALWEIADASGSYVAADAVIVGNDTVAVSSPLVSNPVSARYAYSTNPEGNNLINSAGLPASPIREVTPGGGGPLCIVDLENFATFASHWLDGPCNEINNWCGGADLNQLDDVTLDDLTILTGYWLEVCPFGWALD
jgi:sialate O-acetylesterase